MEIFSLHLRIFYKQDQTPCPAILAFLKFGIEMQIHYLNSLTSSRSQSQCMGKNLLKVSRITLEQTSIAQQIYDTKITKTNENI